MNRVAAESFRSSLRVSPSRTNPSPKRVAVRKQHAALEGSLASPSTARVPRRGGPLSVSQPQPSRSLRESAENDLVPLPFYIPGDSVINAENRVFTRLSELQTILERFKGKLHLTNERLVNASVLRASPPPAVIGTPRDVVAHSPTMSPPPAQQRTRELSPRAIAAERLLEKARDVERQLRDLRSSNGGQVGTVTAEMYAAVDGALSKCLDQQIRLEQCRSERM